MDDLVKLEVDGDRCIGSGMCEMLEELIFVVDDTSYVATAVGEAELPRERAATVIDRCPSSAIREVDTGTPSQ